MLEKGLSSYQLKIIALVFMIIDHIGVFFPSTPILLRWLGRFSAPIFMFCCVQSFNNTHNKKKYLLRLYIASVFMSFIQIYLNIDLNFFRTLFFLSTILYLVDIGYKNPNFKKYLFIYITWQALSTISTIILISNSSSRTEDYLIYLVPALFGNSFNLEGGLFIVTLGIIFYFAKNDRIKLIISFIIYDIFYCILFLTPIVSIVLCKFRYLCWGTDILADILSDFIEFIVGIPLANRGGQVFFVNFQWMMIFSLIPILLYNCKRGKLQKMFFYIFYPAHIILLYIISNL